MTETLMTEFLAYAIAAECLKPIEQLVEPHKLQQVADKIVAALLEVAVDEMVTRTVKTGSLHWQK